MLWNTALAFSGKIADWFQNQLNRRDADTANRMGADNASIDRALQREFAQNGIKWRMEDAERAGVHPLYALGATGATYSPTISTFQAPPSNYRPGEGMAEMGQNISRAINATGTQNERKIQALQIQGMDLDNQFKAQQLKNITPGPAFPNPSSSGLNYNGIPGQGDGYPTMVHEMPARVTMSEPGNRAQDVGSIPDYALTRTPTGMAIVPSKDIKERIEDQIVPETMWAIRNNLVPFFTGHKAPDPRIHKLPTGAYKWKWDWTTQEFRPVYPGRKMRID